ncbi:MAG: PEP-CTERM sorting domain-containing protein [Thermoguttaceae bacterium]|nr:PEP-CTERM sorting domain-containing protein [Thermoguttaceae bacterium]
MNKPVVFLSRFFAALVVTALTVSAFADYVPFVSIDFNSAGSGTMTGYNGSNFADDTLTSTVYVSPENGITVTTTRETTKNNRNRSNSNCDALTNDFIFENTVGKTVSSTITGLTVGKEYVLNVYTHDTGSGASSASTWSLAQGEGEAVNIGTVTNTQSGHKITDANTHLTYTFTAEADTVVLTGGISNGLVVLNGLDLSEAYEAGSGYTKFDVNSNQKDGTESRVTSPRSTELFVDNTNTSTSATVTAPSGVTLTVTSNNVLNSRTRKIENSAVDMNLYNDFVFSGSKTPFTVSLDNLTANAIYRMKVYSFDPTQDQCGGIWTMTDANGDEIFSYTHNLTFGTSSTWSFEQTFKPATTSVSMLAERTAKPYTMFNGMELQEISPNTADYTWSAGRAGWLADGKWIDKTGAAGTPTTGDICYISSPDPTGMNRDYWFETTTTEFPATLVMASGSRMIFKSNATANDLILDNGYLHHGEGSKTFALAGNLTIAGNSTIDIDDGSSRTLQINSVMTGSGNLTILGNGASNATVELSRGYAGYSGNIILNKVNLKLTTGNGCVGSGDLDIPDTSRLTLNEPNYGLHYVNNLTGSGPISVTATSRFDLASSEPQAYSGTISVAANQSMHIGYTISGDSASDVNLPNATISLASGANLGLIHQSSSSKVSSLTIGTLNGVADSFVRASGSVSTSSGAKMATLTVGEGDFAGVIGGTVAAHTRMSLIKNTDGTLTLSGANVYAGGTTIEGGKIVLAGAGALGTGAVVIGESGTLEYNVADGAEKTVAITSANAISGAGKVVKVGDGVLKINNEGYADSFASSQFEVNAGELDFKGEYTGDMIIGAQGVLSPGNSVGTLSVTGNVTVDGTALFEFGSFEEGLFDQLFILGDGNAFTAGDSTIEISFLNGDQDAWATPDSAYQLVADDGFQIGDFTSWLTDDFGGLFGLEGRTDGLYLVAAAGPEPGSGVPEPSTWALLALGVIFLFLRKRS